MEKENLDKEEKEKTQKRIFKRIELIKEELSKNDDYFNGLIESNNNKEEANKSSNDLLTLKDNRLNVETKPNTDNDGLISRLSASIEEYRKVIDYFAKNNRSSSLQEATTRAKEIKDALDKVKKGEEIIEAFLPLKITPEFICGMDTEEKVKKYKELFVYFFSEKKEKTQKLNELLDFYKGKGRNKVKQNINSVRSVLDNLKNEIEEIKQTIKKLKEYQNNIWMPFPEIMENENEEIIECINKDVDDNSLLIQVEVVDKQIKSNLILHLTIVNVIDEMISLKKKKNNDLVYDQLIKLGSNCQTIIGKELVLQIMGNGCCSENIIIHKNSINLNALSVKATIAIDEPFTLKNESKLFIYLNLVYQIHLNIKVHKALKEPELLSVVKKKIEIITVYPPYK